MYINTNKQHKQETPHLNLSNWGLRHPSLVEATMRKVETGHLIHSSSNLTSLKDLLSMTGTLKRSCYQSKSPSYSLSRSCFSSYKIPQMNTAVLSPRNPQPQCLHLKRISILSEFETGNKSPTSLSAVHVVFHSL